VAKVHAPSGWAGQTVYTVGHSTRTWPELVDLLQAHGIRLLADIRKLPGSRKFPQFDREALERALPEAGIVYVHLPALGGRRPAHKTSPNTGWRNASFRGYADYMATEAFEGGLEQLRSLLPRGPVAIMCAEAVPWRCHRSLVSDALLARGARVLHLGTASEPRPHELTAFARVDGEHVTYPPEGDAEQELPFPRS
jgi:uncharacterized protein (DUF488 family)